MKSKLFLFPFFLVIYEFFVNLSNDMYLPALPEMAENLQTTPHWIQYTITAWLAGSIFVQLILGPLSDLWGRRPVLLMSGVIFLSSTFGCAFSSSIFPILMWRFFQGIGVCGVMVAGYASIHELFEDKKSIRILAWMNCMAIIAPMAGPLAGGYIVSYFGWRMIFVLLGVFAAFGFTALCWAMPESLKSKGSFCFSKLTGDYKRLACNSTFISSAFSFGLLYGGVIVWMTSSPFLLIEKEGFSPQMYGYLQIPIFAAYFCGTRIMDRFLNELEIEKLISLGLGVSGISALLMAIFTSILSYHPVILLFMAGFAFGFGFASAPLIRTTFNAAKEKKGVVSAAFYFCMMGVGMLGSLFAGILDGYHFVGMSWLICLMALGAFFINRVRIKIGSLKTKEGGG